MTCIVGIGDGKNCWIGGDSAGVGSWDLTVRKDPKVFKRQEFLIGFTTSFRMGQILRFNLSVPKLSEGQDHYEYMVTAFIPAVRQCLKDGGFATRDKEQEAGGVFLVGFRGQIYSIDSDYQVGIPSESFHACGCGAAYALGSLHSSTNNTSFMERIDMALRVAEKCSAGVRGPFVVLSSGEING